VCNEAVATWYWRVGAGAAGSSELAGKLASEHAAAIAGEVERRVDEEAGGEGGDESFFEATYCGAIADDDEVVPEIGAQSGCRTGGDDAMDCGG